LGSAPDDATTTAVPSARSIRIKDGPTQGGAHAPTPELHLTVAAVKTPLRSLFQRFGIEELPKNEKRAELIRIAFETSAVSSADIGRPA
jgi:hypothetical protein